MKKDLLNTIVLASIICALIMLSSKAKAGALQGLTICEEIIIPSLLPILILTSTIQKSKCSIIFERLFGKATEIIFKLPKSCATAIIFGLIGGYPSGAILTDSLYQDGLIDKDTASRIMRFNFSGGLAFIITAVGSIRYNSSKIGLMLFLSCVIPEILIGIASGLKIEKVPESTRLFSERLCVSDALTQSVEATIKSLLIMSGYIVLFSSVCAIVPIPRYLFPIFEITYGVCNSTAIPLDYCAFFIAFGGICVHMQILNKMQIPYLEFFIFRIVNALLSFLIMRLLLFIFPQDEGVFSNLSGITSQLTEVNAGFGIIMIIGCAVLILDIEGRKIKLR